MTTGRVMCVDVKTALERRSATNSRGRSSDITSDFQTVWLGFDMSRLDFSRNLRSCGYRSAFASNGRTHLKGVDKPLLGMGMETLGTAAVITEPYVMADGGCSGRVHEMQNNTLTIESRLLYPIQARLSCRLSYLLVVPEPSSDCWHLDRP